jgi:hypothetical protein
MNRLVHKVANALHLVTEMRKGVVDRSKYIRLHTENPRILEQAVIGSYTRM